MFELCNLIYPSVDHIIYDMPEVCGPVMCNALCIDIGTAWKWPCADSVHHELWVQATQYPLLMQKEIIYNLQHVFAQGIATW